MLSARMFRPWRRLLVKKLFRPTTCCILSSLANLRKTLFLKVRYLSLIQIRKLWSLNWIISNLIVSTTKIVIVCLQEIMKIVLYSSRWILDGNSSVFSRRKCWSVFQQAPSQNSILEILVIRNQQNWQPKCRRILIIQPFNASLLRIVN